jgi:hypothetical protein
MNLKKTEELIIASMQIKNSEMGDNPVGRYILVDSFLILDSGQCLF